MIKLLRKAKNNLHDFLIFKKRRYISDKKFNKIVNDNDQFKESIDEEFEDHVINYWKKRYNIRLNPLWHHIYSFTSGVKDVAYIPDDLFVAKFIYNLNRMNLRLPFADKNNTDLFLDNVRQPKIILKNINGHFFNENNEVISINKAQNVLNRKGKYIIKPSIDSGSGRGIRLIYANNDKIFLNDELVTFEDIHKLYKNDYLIQEFLQQGEILAKFHPQSINTLRVISLNIQDNIVFPSTVVRFGSSGAYTDNFGTEGLSCGVNEFGELNETGLDSRFNTVDKHPDTQVEFKGTKIPNYKKLLKYLESLHKKLPYFNCLSWDIAIDNNNEFVLIEINNGFQGVNLHQLNNGPIFKPYIDYIVTGKI